MNNDIWDPIKRSGYPDMANSSKGKILVSGTHHDTRFMMRVLLEMWGYEVAEADGEEETVRMAESYLPNVILVDTSRLFDEDIKVVSKLRIAKLPRLLPILVLSGFTQTKYQKAAKDHGATSLLAKPLDLDRLESFLETALPV
jgi:response regulator RpfG family c-di-GMP phosphodiesterase